MNVSHLDRVTSRVERKLYALIMLADDTDFRTEVVDAAIVHGEGHTSHSWDCTITVYAKNGVEIPYSTFASEDDATQAGIYRVTQRRDALRDLLSRCEKTLANKWVYLA